MTASLGYVDTRPFERFAQDFLGDQLGTEFVPHGGMHDAGADGVFYDTHDAAPSRFMQASTTDAITQKIKDTVRDLRAVGRNVVHLDYASSRDVAKADLLERSLAKELGVSVRIYGASYFATHINTSAATQAAYRHHLAYAIEHLTNPGRSAMAPVSRHVQSPGVYVFLRQELDRRQGDTSLVDALVDALVLWALEGTDPDKNILLARADLPRKVKSQLPAVSSLFEKHLDRALTRLSDKTRPAGRAVRWYQHSDQFCLPFDERQRIQEANAADEALLAAVLRHFTEGAAEIIDTLSTKVGSGIAHQCAQLARSVVVKLFEQQGIEFASFIMGREASESLASVPDAVDALLPSSGIANVNQPVARHVVPTLLRRAIYDPTAEERELFQKLSRTYCLLFSLQADPKVAEYLQELRGDFVLYAGADILIRAMAERYVLPDSQMIRTALKMITDAGGTLLLTEPALDEVVRHLRSSDHEFRQHFLHLEHCISDELASFSDKILVRAYIHARSPGGARTPPASWNGYLAQFCTPSQLAGQSAFTEIRDYLQAEFQMEYVSRRELESMVDAKQLEDLARRIEPQKQHQQLAKNDALLALAVYGRREQQRESSGTSPFGYRTWWLTGEVTIQTETRDLVRAHHGERYMMRPEFLVHFIALTPSASEVRRTYSAVFPSVMGIRLSRRVKGSELTRILGELDAARELTPARRTAAVRQAIDRLKAVGRPYQPLSSSGVARDRAPRAAGAPRKNPRAGRGKR